MNTHSTATALTRKAMMNFVRSWVAAWNRHNADSVLSHFMDESVFVSPVASKYVGSPVIGGKSELSRHWHAALDRLSTFELKLDCASWEPERRGLNVVYESNLNGVRRRSGEMMTFNTDGGQIRGGALYGAELWRTSPLANACVKLQISRTAQMPMQLHNMEA